MSDEELVMSHCADFRSRDGALGVDLITVSAEAHCAQPATYNLPIKEMLLDHHSVHRNRIREREEGKTSGPARVRIPHDRA